MTNIEMLDEIFNHLKKMAQREIDNGEEDNSPVVLMSLLSAAMFSSVAEPLKGIVEARRVEGFKLFLDALAKDAESALEIITHKPHEVIFAVFEREGGDGG